MGFRPLRTFTVCELALCVCLAHAPVLAQSIPPPESLRVVILSPRVGDVIDRDERQSYALFRQIVGFAEARFFQRSDSTFIGVYRLRDPDGSLRDSVAVHSIGSLLRFSWTIDHFQELGQGTYVFGSDAASMTVGGIPAGTWQPKIAKTNPAGSVRAESMVPGTERPSPYGWILPLGPPPGPPPAEMRRTLFAGLTACLGSTNLDDFDAAFAKIEDAYRASGHPDIPTGRFDPRPMSFGMEIHAEISGGFAFQFTYAPSLDPNLQLGCISAGGSYLLNLVPDGNQGVEFSLGIVRYSLHLRRSYGTQLTPSDGYGGYDYLSDISIDAPLYGAVLGIAYVAKVTPEVQFVIGCRAVDVPSVDIEFDQTPDSVPVHAAAGLRMIGVEATMRISLE